MKKIAVLLVICILCASIPFSVTAEAPATTDWPYEDGIDYIGGTVTIKTDSILDLQQYESETSFDFFGVSAVSLESLYGDEEATKEFFERIGYCLYSLRLDSFVTVKDAVAVLSATEKFVEVMPNWRVYLDEDYPPRWRKGDINRDGTIDAFDCLKVKGRYFGTANLSEIQIERADVNKDGEIDMFDYLEVKAICFEQ